MRILAVSLGGTIAQTVEAGRMNVARDGVDLWASFHEEHEIIHRALDRVKGGNVSLDTVIAVRNEILEQSDSTDGAVVTTGTDSIEELSYALDLLIPDHVPVVVLGAMKPFDSKGFDGFEAIAHSIQALNAIRGKRLGVTTLINGELHAARYVRKYDSQFYRPLSSHPGPLAECRSGRCWLFTAALPEIEKFSNVSAIVPKNIPLVSMAIGMDFDWINFDGLHGLVVEGLGTGSLSDIALNTLAKHTNDIPIVVTTRCWSGLAYDEVTYKGSLDRYDRAGLLVRGYEFLSGAQARIQLTLSLQPV